MADDTTTSPLDSAWDAAGDGFGDTPVGSAATACPLQAAAAAPAQRASTAPDCKNMGMVTDANVAEFVKDFKQLQKDWPTLTPDQRQERMKEIANKQLTKSGAPPCGVRGVDTGGAGNATMNFPTNELFVNKGTIDSNTLSDSDAKEMADTVFHETRHGEQWYLMSTKAAADAGSPGIPTSPSMIMKSVEAAQKVKAATGVTDEVASAAALHPLDPNAPQAKCAQKLWDSVYGANATSRNATINALKPTGDAYTDAAKKYQAVLNDPHSTQAQKDAANATYQTSKAAYDTNYESYRMLPEENDAWAAGDKMQAAW